MEKELLRAIENVWQQIGSDAMELVDSNEDAIELVLDADRMILFGEEEAGLRMKEIVRRNGFQETVEEVARELSLL